MEMCTPPFQIEFSTQDSHPPLSYGWKCKLAHCLSITKYLYTLTQTKSSFASVMIGAAVVQLL